MAVRDRSVRSGRCRDTAAPDGREPVCYSFAACVRCPAPEPRLLGGLRPAPRGPSIRVLPRPDPALPRKG